MCECPECGMMGGQHTQACSGTGDDSWFACSAVDVCSECDCPC